MIFTPTKINRFLLFKLPAAYLCGVRVRRITDAEVIVRLKHKWINQNPFRSIFWAVQGMASELTTGVLVMREIANSGKSISMLVTHMEGTFSKKAAGIIVFSCKDSEAIRQAVERTIETGEGQIVCMTSEGKNEAGVSVSKFVYHWSIRVKS